MKIEDVLAQFAGDHEDTEKTASEKGGSAATENDNQQGDDEVMKIAKALRDNPEAMAALNSLVDDQEKNAELEKMAEELEIQGRFFGRGIIAEQTKIAYLMEQVDDDYVEKVAESLGMDPYELMGIDKEGEANIEAAAKASKDSAAGKENDAPLIGKGRPVAKGNELSALASIAAVLKKARTDATQLPVNG